MAISTQRNTHLLANYKCILICAAMALGSCQYGFDGAAVAGFQAMPGFLRVFGYYDTHLSGEGGGGWAIDTRTQQLISSTLNMGTILGTCMTALFGRYLGRRPGIWTACAISFVSCGIQIGTSSVGVLCLGRVLLGISNAFFATFCNVYSVEATPAHLRAIVASLFGVWTCFGNLLGALINQRTAGLESRLSYQIPLAALYVIPGTLCALVLMVPESPRWLLVQGGREGEAERSLRRLRGDTLVEESLIEEFVEMRRGIEEEKGLDGGSKGGEEAFWDMFKEGSNRRRTIITLGVYVYHSASGIWLFIAYSVRFFFTFYIKFM